MAVVTPGDYEELEAEYKASQQQLASKDQALKIFQEQLKNSEFNSQRLQQEINQLRSQLTRVQLPHQNGEEERGVAQSVSEKERYLQELEAAQVQISELERQVQVVEDEKAELASERDYFSGKCESLVKCLEEERSTPVPTQSTLQSAIEENKLLKLELVEVKAERDHAQSRIERYKKAVERRRVIEASANQGLQQSPNPDKKHQLHESIRRVKELEALANNLSETVKEKSIALLHQKKANKMLATRITELEHKLKVVEISGLWTSSDVIPQLNQVPLIPETVGDHISHPPVVCGGNGGTPQGPQVGIGQTTELEEDHEGMGNNCEGKALEGSNKLSMALEGTSKHSVLLSEH